VIQVAHLRVQLLRCSLTRGRFSALRENGVHHFQSLVIEFLDRD